MLPRVIPILGIDGNRLVKTVKFQAPRYIGDPLNAIKIFNNKMVDEIAIIDIRATKNGQDPNYKLIGEMAEECFSPLSYGGGVRTFEQAKRIFDLGVEKVILNSIVFENPDIIRQITESYGSQSCVVSLDVIKNVFGRQKKVVYQSGSKNSGMDLINAIKRFQNKGAGEILLQDINRDGTFLGYNVDLIKIIKDSVDVPLVVLGGCNGIKNMKEALYAGADAVAASSYFVFRNNNPESILIHYPAYDIINKELDLQ